MGGSIACVGAAISLGGCWVGSVLVMLAGVPFIGLGVAISFTE